MARRTADLWVTSLATLLLLLTAIVVWGWVRVPGEPWRTFPDPAARADTGVELRVILRRDTISSRDRSPVEVLYFIVNGPAQTEFNNNPEHFAFLVEDTKGRPVQPALWSHRPTQVHGPMVNVTLPAGAILGQLEDLRCVRYGAYGRAAGTTFGNCMRMWDFAVPGIYRVIVKYNGPDQWAHLDGIRADTASIDMEEEPIAIGRRLADTATLVVR